MISDDTEHALFVGQALLREPDDVNRFQRVLAWKLRWWFLSLPAGVGMATAKACIKLWLGFPARSSGVFSAGNGPAMRSGIIGAYFADQPEQRRAYVKASTCITHTDPKANYTALAIAEGAAWVTRGGSDPAEFLQILPACGEGAEWIGICEGLRGALEKQITVSEYAISLGLARGVSGYAYHTVPVALYAWLRHFGDFRATLIAVLDCGGDTDTVGAIVGALAGARAGGDGVPQEWLSGIVEWPRTPALLSEVAGRLAIQRLENKAGGEVGYCWLAIPFRNVLFLAIVLFHGFRRLLPPY